MFRLLILVVSSLLASEVLASDSIAKLLASDPTAEAERAFATGDHRHIVVPVCGSQTGEIIPGWPLKQTSAVLDAIEKGRRPVTCADFGHKPATKEFARVTEYAALYNQRLLELTLHKGKRNAL